jgi:hypothetical protein
MKKRLPWVLLAVSAAFNVFLVAGALTARARHEWKRTPEGRADVLADRLGMDEEQRAAYLELVRAFEPVHREMRGRRGEEYRTVWTELAKDRPDESVFDEFVRARGSSEWRRRFLEHARSLVRILRPEQRRRVAEVMERLHRRHGK